MSMHGREHPDASVGQLMLRLERDFPQAFACGPVALVRVDAQRLDLIREGRILASYPVSTASAGVGNAQDSFRTPPGVHRIWAKYGESQPPGMMFRARVPTGEIAPVIHEARCGDGDCITSRILWLEGLEPGINAGPGIDSRQRFIYIHGTNEEGLLGLPVSKGCIRMANSAVIEVYAALPQGSLVVIL